MPQLTILADENIPLVRELFGRFGSVETLPGRQITREHVQRADVLLVRSVTRVDEDLMNGSPIRFVGSATIGTDHIDTAYLKHEGVEFAHAPGSNADSVVEYVIAAMLHQSSRRGAPLRGKSVGIVGCGAIGSRLAARLAALGLSILKNDPPLADEAERRMRRHDYVALDDLIRGSDIITLHVPLIRSGPYSTTHLFNRDRLEQMKKGAWLINTARGSVVDNQALRERLELRRGSPDAAILDVWEDEPLPDPALVRLVDLATPHIAGYSYDGKIAGSLMLHRALSRFLDVPVREPDPDLLPHLDRQLTAPDPVLPESDYLHALTRQMYAIAEDDLRMRQGLAAADPQARAEHFTALRREYPVRRTFSAFGISPALIPERLRPRVADGLRVYSRKPYERR